MPCHSATDSNTYDVYNKIGSSNQQDVYSLNVKHYFWNLPPTILTEENDASFLSIRNWLKILHGTDLQVVYCGWATNRTYILLN